MSTFLKLYCKKVPQVPGVYFFRDRSGKVLYLGKAANLRNRLKSYFDKSPKNPRLQKMLEAAKNVDWQETNSEIEALILESQLIKKYRPPFNIMLRDDKQYFFVVFSTDPFPKIITTHRPILFTEPKIPSSKSQVPNKFQIPNLKPNAHSPKSSFIGPFTDGAALKATLKLLRRIFPYCTCKQKHNNYCLNYHIGNCLGFCCLKKEATIKQVAIYKKNITAIKEILSGKKQSLIKGLEKELNILAQKEKFEKAIELRDKIEKLKRVFENARIIQNANLQIDANTMNNKTLEELKKSLKLLATPQRIEGYDVSNIQGEFATGAMVVFTDGKPDKNEYRKFKIRAAGGDTGMIQEILTRRFNHPEWQCPNLILIDGGKAQLSTAHSATTGHRKTYGLAMSKDSISVIALTKDAKHKGHHIYESNKKTAMPLKNLPPAVANLILRIDAEAHRFAIGYYRKLHRKIIN